MTRLDEQLADGCRQVVILGAGLDTRAERKRSDGVAYFEIDDASTVDFKRQRLAERGVEAPTTFIAGNYVTSGVLPLLEANGFNRDLPSFFIWEGNTMYLTEADAPKGLARPQGGRATVQHFLRLHGQGGGREDDRRGGNHDLRRALRRTWARPGITASTISNAVAAETGLTVADAITLGDLHRKFWPERPLESIVYEHYSLCTLKP